MIDTRRLISAFCARVGAQSAAIAVLLVLAFASWPVSMSGQRPSVVTAAVDPLPSFSEPAISPDRTEIAVVSGGDIWTVPTAGGDARLLVSHDAAESRPLYSPEGDRLAFVSDRTGGGDIYVLTLKTGALQQVTVDDGLERLDAWSRDGKWLYFSSTGRDIAGMNDIYRVRVDGGTPMLDERGPLHRRVLRGTVARRAAPGVHRARQQFRTVVAQGTLAPGRVRALGPEHVVCRRVERRVRGRTSLRASHGARRQAHVADVERRRPKPLLHVR